MRWTRSHHSTSLRAQAVALTATETPRFQATASTECPGVAVTCMGKPRSNLRDGLGRIERSGLEERASELHSLPKPAHVLGA